MDNPATARPATTKFARLTRGSVVSVDYRLSPQSQFPAVKAQASPTSTHRARSESYGGGLCLSLIQLLLDMRRSQQRNEPQITFGGRDVPVPMPAGVALLGAEVGRSLELPSWNSPANDAIAFIQEIQPANAQSRPPDDVWPSNPPRHDVYCHSSALLRSIANPCTAADWSGCPPLWLSYGEERCIDGGKAIASLATSQQVAVQFSEDSGLPLIFPIVMAPFKQSKMCMQEWADTCREMAKGRTMLNSAKQVSSVNTPGDTTISLDLKSLFTIARLQMMVMNKVAKEARPLYTGMKATKASL